MAFGWVSHHHVASAGNVGHCLPASDSKWTCRPTIRRRGGGEPPGRLSQSSACGRTYRTRPALASRRCTGMSTGIAPRRSVDACCLRVRHLLMPRSTPCCTSTRPLAHQPACRGSHACGGSRHRPYASECTHRRYRPSTIPVLRAHLLRRRVLPRRPRIRPAPAILPRRRLPLLRLGHVEACGAAVRPACRRRTQGRGRGR